jgi:hypothetical protein
MADDTDLIRGAAEISFVISAILTPIGSNGGRSWLPGSSARSMTAS